MVIEQSNDNQLTWMTSSPDPANRDIMWCRHPQAAPPSVPMVECFVIAQAVPAGGGQGGVPVATAQAVAVAAP